MSPDLFSFWSRIAPTDRVHPADAAVFERVKNRHQFDLDCLPGAYMGPLRTAPVVLLFLSPGLAPLDHEEALSADGQARYVEQRSGNAPIPTREEHPLAFQWWWQRASFLGEINDLRFKVAVLNIGAYHSRSFSDWPMLASLPSSRASLAWAQHVLFPEAEAGKRVVVCLRSPGYWGLAVQAEPFGKALFAPATTRAGHMIRGEGRDRVVHAAREILNA